MAPTEILAEQHFLTLRRLLQRCPYRVELLTSAVKGKERAEALARIASGEAQIVVGTHALIQEGVALRAPRASRSSTSSTASACCSARTCARRATTPTCS